MMPPKSQAPIKSQKGRHAENVTSASATQPRPAIMSCAHSGV